jgi:pyruvate kinase
VLLSSRCHRHSSLLRRRFSLSNTCIYFISIHKGVNTPDSILQISCLTKKDREDLNYMLGIGVDWVALSFVQRPEDIVEIKRLIMEYNPTNAFPPHVMAKIEKPSCFVGDSLEKIVQLSDGISE